MESLLTSCVVDSAVVSSATASVVSSSDSSVVSSSVVSSVVAFPVSSAVVSSATASVVSSSVVSSTDEPSLTVFVTVCTQSPSSFLWYPALNIAAVSTTGELVLAKLISAISPTSVSAILFPSPSNVPSLSTIVSKFLILLAPS